MPRADDSAQMEGFRAAISPGTSASIPGDVLIADRGWPGASRTTEQDVP